MRREVGENGGQPNRARFWGSRRKPIFTKKWGSFLLKIPSLLLGLFLFAVGVVANLYSDLGLAPWVVLHVGLSKVTPLTIGQTSQIVGFIVIVIGWALGFPRG